MRSFSWISGRLTEVQRFISVPMRWCEQYPARERRELWLTTAGGDEFKLVVHTRVMPARAGHQVICVLYSGQLVGLMNLSTGDQVVFAESDPPLLWRRCDGGSLVLLGATALTGFLGGWGLVGSIALASALLLPPAVLLAGWYERIRLVRTARVALADAHGQATRQHRLVRVK